MADHAFGIAARWLDPPDCIRTEPGKLVLFRNGRTFPNMEASTEPWSGMRQCKQLYVFCMGVADGSVDGWCGAAGCGDRSQ